MKSWNVELDELLEKIERYTTAPLWRIRSDFERSNLTFDRKFRKRFLRLTYNRLSEVYEQIEIEAMAENQQNIYGRYDGIRIGNQRHAHESSMEQERIPKRKCERNDLKDERSTKKIKYSSIQSSNDVHKRLGEKVNENKDDDLSFRIIEPIIDQSNDAKQPFSDVKVIVEMHSPILSPCNRLTSKRKHNIDKCDEDKAVHVKNEKLAKNMVTPTWV